MALAFGNTDSDSILDTDVGVDIVDGISIGIAITSANKFDHPSSLEVNVYVVFHKFMLMLIL